MNLFFIILSVLSAIGNLIKGYEFLQEMEMKIDTAWLFLFIILIFSVGYLFLNWYKKYKRLLEWINHPADHISKYNNLASMIQVIVDSRISKK